MEEILKLVKEDLAKRLSVKTLDDYDSIPFETAKALLEDEDILIYGEFKDSLNSPWSIAKYIRLYLDEKSLIKKVEEDLNTLPPKIEYCFVKHLSCNVQFNRVYEEGVKKQVLVVKYYLDEDDKIQYKLTNAGTNSCWDITKGQLKGLLASEVIIPEKVVIKSKKGIFNWIKRKLGF
jgi:hypothetical protein